MEPCRRCRRLLLHTLILFFADAAMSQLPPPNQGSIGVCNGRVGSNLPAEQEVVELYKAHRITRMRIYDPNPATLAALRASNIHVILGVPNSDLQSLQSDRGAAHWLHTHLLPHHPATTVKYIAVGNEIDPDSPDTSRYAPLLLPAMRALHRQLTLLNLHRQIKVSTATFSALVRDSYPPSNATFKHPAFMHPIAQFLAETNSPLLANIYPYFAHIGDPVNVPLAYALFAGGPGSVVRDGPLVYRNLFDAMVDSMYSATEKAGAPGVEVVVSESGWPSAGGPAATMENADAYYRNLIAHVRNGTPKRPGKAIETYLFAMFDENLKPGALTEQHFGLFYPSKQIKYQVSFFNV
ncbi:glucan endo-1,3-beta-glucosidase, acidic-like [Andrographis paniculata]|uniref:glucan endo-1,3-beta-glucosidase, acidic-like n=1 Tax=Andrographis paniculata TaxID=175694 RepID=UPI0021E7A2D7|nr:glucan endo-1,3-beta-glucosidase, acidic-like [Andrographis paniculata]